MRIDKDSRRYEIADAVSLDYSVEVPDSEYLSPTSHILGIIGKLKGTSYIIGGHSM